MIAPAFAGAELHRPAAIGAEANAGKESGAAHDAGGHDLGVARLEMRLHGVEGRLIDQRRHLDRHDLACGLQFLGLAALVELVAAHVGRSGEDAMKLADAPAPSRVKMRRALR
ncbi:MAG: hypothetical protein JWM91_313 [Rhodospirillales bacterium]|nr:hypothetical protein [Rhodospirillales bacterium]